MEVYPNRRLAAKQCGRGPLREPESPERLGGNTSRRIEARADAVHYRHRHQGCDTAPFLPAMKAAQIVGTHDPNKVHARTATHKIADRIVRIAHADLGLETADVDGRMIRQGAGGRHSAGKRAQAPGVLEWIARRHQPPDAMQAKPSHRDQAGSAMGLMRRIESAAEQTNPHAARVGRQNAHGLVWPEPRTRYLKVVSCSTPTGPRAWKRPVAMPISAPKPNSPPSANWVEALCSTIAESMPSRNFSAAASSSVTIESVWWEP